MKLLFTLSLALVVLLGASAQTVKVVSVEHNMSLGSRKALSAQINRVEAEDAIKDFVSFWKGEDARPEFKNGEMKSINYEVKSFSPKMFSLFAAADKEGKDDCTVYLWVSDGIEFIGSSHPAYDYFEKKMKEFAVAENKKPYEKELKVAAKLLNNLNDDQKSLEQKRMNWQKDIDDCTEEIKDRQVKLKESETNLTTLKEKVKQQEVETQNLQKKINGIQ